jgi:hypothetical protein
VLSLRRSDHGFKRRPLLLRQLDRRRFLDVHPILESGARPEVVVEVIYLTWTEDNLLRQVSYQGQCEDEPAGQVVRAISHPPH